MFTPGNLDLTSQQDTPQDQASQTKLDGNVPSFIIAIGDRPEQDCGVSAILWQRRQQKAHPNVLNIGNRIGKSKSRQTRVPSGDSGDNDRGSAQWEQLQQHGLVEALFEQFEGYLQQSGYQAKDGQIVDATLVPVPTQRNRKAENQQIKDGQLPATWLEQPHKQAEKDIDARWIKKNNVSHFGYKDHR